MSGVTTKAEHLGLDTFFHCLANTNRRLVLGRLYDRAPEPLRRQDLAAHLDTDDQANSGELAPDEGIQQVLSDLHHIQVPKLEAAGLIEQDTDRGTVTITDHPAFEDAGIIDVISDETSADFDSLDSLFAALADSRRRTILDVLSHQFGPIHAETLARELGAREQGLAESDVPAENVERILVDLVHVRLPQLSDAELIEYDTDDQTVAYKGHPGLRVPWMHSVLEPMFRQSLTGELDTEGIGEIRDRETVISFGQWLCDRADEELFCMFTDTNLLEAGCLTRIRQASNRGADVYLGTRDPTVREYVRENVPDVVLWEPNTDWLNLPVSGNRVGRLLLADRDAVMLGTLLEETTDGLHEEQAIIGEGARDTLVTMVSQLVHPHLEQIDQETEDIASELPL